MDLDKISQQILHQTQKDPHAVYDIGLQIIDISTTLKISQVTIKLKQDLVAKDRALINLRDENNQLLERIQNQRQQIQNLIADQQNPLDREAKLKSQDGESGKTQLAQKTHQGFTNGASSSSFQSLPQDPTSQTPETRKEREIEPHTKTRQHTIKDPYLQPSPRFSTSLKNTASVSKRDNMSLEYSEIIRGQTPFLSPNTFKTKPDSRKELYRPRLKSSVSYQSPRNSKSTPKSSMQTIHSLEHQRPYSHMDVARPMNSKIKAQSLQQRSPYYQGIRSQDHWDQGQQLETKSEESTEALLEYDMSLNHLNSALGDPKYSKYQVNYHMRHHKIRSLPSAKIKSTFTTSSLNLNKEQQGLLEVHDLEDTSKFNDRKSKFYSISPDPNKQIQAEVSTAISRPQSHNSFNCYSSPRSIRDSFSFKKEDKQDAQLKKDAKVGSNHTRHKSSIIDNSSHSNTKNNSSSINNSFHSNVKSLDNNRNINNSLHSKIVDKSRNIVSENNSQTLQYNQRDPQETLSYLDRQQVNLNKELIRLYEEKGKIRNPKLQTQSFSHHSPLNGYDNGMDQQQQKSQNGRSHSKKIQNGDTSRYQSTNINIKKNLVFETVRQRLSQEQFKQFQNLLQRFTTSKISKSEFLKHSGDLFGVTNTDLYYQVFNMIQGPNPAL